MAGTDSADKNEESNNLDEGIDMLKFFDTIELNVDLFGCDGMTYFGEVQAENDTSTKRKRFENFTLDDDIPILHGVEYEDSSDEEVEEEGAKFAKNNSLHRIIRDASSAILPSSGASKNISVNNIMVKKMREETISEFWRLLNFGDRQGVASWVREHCDESCELITSDMPSFPVVGRRDIMMWFSVLFEIFPDGIWQRSAEMISNDFEILCEYIFEGTNIFNKTIETIFLQMRAKAQKPMSFGIASEASIHKSRSKDMKTESDAIDGTESSNSKRLVKSTSHRVMKIDSEEWNADEFKIKPQLNDIRVSLANQIKVRRPTKFVFEEGVDKNILKIIFEAHYS